MKAKEFVRFLTEELDYRVFTGIPCNMFKPIYDNMDKDLMYHIPAINEKSAVSIAAGTWLGGFNSVVMIEKDLLESALLISRELHEVLGISLLIITSSIEKGSSKAAKNIKAELKALTNTIREERTVGVFALEEGMLE
jgi:sulfopyruvate decarboxylase TPP-binding subunit